MHLAGIGISAHAGEPSLLDAAWQALRRHRATRCSEQGEASCAFPGTARHGEGALGSFAGQGGRRDSRRVALRWPRVQAGSADLRKARRPRLGRHWQRRPGPCRFSAPHLPARRSSRVRTALPGLFDASAGRCDRHLHDCDRRVLAGPFKHGTGRARQSVRTALCRFEVVAVSQDIAVTQPGGRDFRPNKQYNSRKSLGMPRFARVGSGPPRHAVCTRRSGGGAALDAARAAVGPFHARAFRAMSVEDRANGGRLSAF